MPDKKKQQLDEIFGPEKSKKGKKFDPAYDWEMRKRDMKEAIDKGANLDVLNDMFYNFPSQGGNDADDFYDMLNELGYTEEGGEIIPFDAKPENAPGRDGDPEFRRNEIASEREQRAAQYNKEAGGDDNRYSSPNSDIHSRTNDSDDPLDAVPMSGGYEALLRQIQSGGHQDVEMLLDQAISRGEISEDDYTDLLQEAGNQSRLTGKPSANKPSSNNPANMQQTKEATDEMLQRGLFGPQEASMYQNAQADSAGPSLRGMAGAFNSANRRLDYLAGDSELSPDSHMNAMENSRGYQQQSFDQDDRTAEEYRGYGHEIDPSYGITDVFDEKSLYLDRDPQESIDSGLLDPRALLGQMINGNVSPDDYYEMSQQYGVSPDTQQMQTVLDDPSIQYQKNMSEIMQRLQELTPGIFNRR